MATKPPSHSSRSRAVATKGHSSRTTSSTARTGRPAATSARTKAGTAPSRAKADGRKKSGGAARSAPPKSKRGPGQPVSRTERRRAVKRRRARLTLLASALLSAVILVAWFPATSLYHQRHALATATTELNKLKSQDDALARERVNLDRPGELSRLAREQYQLVSPGQRAFAVLPPNGDSNASTPYPGDPGLIAPVSPTGASELPPGTPNGSSSPSTSTAGQRAATSANTGTVQTSQHQGAWSRIIGDLEFWH